MTVVEEHQPLQHPVSTTYRADCAVLLARDLVAESALLARTMPRAQRASTERGKLLVEDAPARKLVGALTDEVVRVGDHRIGARRFAAVVNEYGISQSFAARDRLLLRVGAFLAPKFPTLVMPLIERHLKRETRSLIVSSDQHRLSERLAAIDSPVNINVLGEAILGPGEALMRFNRVLEAMSRADVNYVSVKLSSIVDGISVVAFDATVERLSTRLRLLYRHAIQTNCFVNLDMEEYRDLDLTVAVFTAVLTEPEFLTVTAGIVLQAYLPDTDHVARGLCGWAKQRCDRGGAPIKVRIVKGANLAMEQVDAELHNWPQAPFTSKVESDANYKKVLATLLAPEYRGAVRVGLASHNVFDIAWALTFTEDAPRIEFEMLHGMAPALAEVMRRRTGKVLLYTPIVASDDFTAAIAYLVRRLDENTSPENALSAMFRIEDDPTVFADQEARFRHSVLLSAELDTTPRRQQNRSLPVQSVLPSGQPFENEADTDFALHGNREWARGLVATDSPVDAPAEVDGIELVNQAVACAITAQQKWRSLTALDRAALIHAVGDVIADRRGEILVAMMHGANKTLSEGDPEVSEAIDFAEYYARLSLRLDDDQSAPLGTIVVTPPWNFPYAIAMGGVLAALAAGNAVLLKPAPQVRDVQHLVALHCWEAGIPTEVLQFLPIPDGDAGRALISHPDVNGVILTGSYETAAMFLDWRPSLNLFAETSGKNAMIVSASADVDLAIKDLVRSAFGHAGQKCSAASIAIVHASLYDDPSFRARISDAVASIRTGSATDLATDVAPLVDQPGPSLLRALTELDPGESWLVQPKLIDAHTNLWSPGVRIGVQPGSWFARTECFGPALGIIRYVEFADAISIQNSTEFGLTAGLHSLDPDEIAMWTDQVEAGNLYVNRTITGAIVQRQPFGGWKRSTVGATAKAGGPRYVEMLRKWPHVDTDDIDVRALTDTFRRWWAHIENREFDAVGLRAESNVYRLRPIQGKLIVRVSRDAKPVDLTVAQAASGVVGLSPIWSMAEQESDELFVQRLAQCVGSTHVRVLGSIGDDALRAGHQAGVKFDLRSPSTNPSVELPRWMREQSVSITRHRHGHIRD
jgi:RHH-type transcriptional regulator, proline utilization regulon repressor / proline dehydrogenase / delta 1-pyrroline-5-carboxylate dehydrogenase